MPKDEKDQPTEKTPTGLTVPVPKRNEFFGNLKKAAKPEPPTASAPRSAVAVMPQQRRDGRTARARRGEK